MSLVGLFALGCGAVSKGNGGSGDPEGTGGTEGSEGPGHTGGGAGGDATPGVSGGGAPPIDDGGVPGPKLRLLTRSEYTSALSDLLGPLNTPLDLPADVSLAGFISIGASQISVSRGSVELYEAAGHAAAAEVFADANRWKKLVGCAPQSDLSDGCIVTFLQRFGKRAYRRELTSQEVARWATIGREAAKLSGSAEQGLAAATSGVLQSFYFLYRVETNQVDPSSGRLKYDGQSMATRLSFLLTGHPPSDALLAAAASGQLDTADGVRAAAAPLLGDPGLVDRLAAFFGEYSQADLALVVQKSSAMFPRFDAALQRAMVESANLFFKNVVLAPGADVRSFYDSDKTFINTELAPIYGAAPPASGFVSLTLAPAAGRAGILGQAAIIAGHSGVDHNSPSRRGVFILQNLLCDMPPVPPPGVNQNTPSDDPGLTSRQRLEAYVSSEPCRSCHQVFDPLGFGLEHFDAIGQYRVTEGDLPIDASGKLDGVSFDGEVGLSTALRENPRALACLVSNFYRDANGRQDAKADAALLDELGKTLAKQKYVWRDLVAEFVASDAFRSAPGKQ